MAPVERMAMRVKEWRERRGLTQEQLAAKAGLSRGFLARLETARHDPKLSTLETGRQDPRVSVLLKIARALKVTVNDLLK